ncbi:hypothetical protein BD410DRAFT_606420 [Rickenella mellea]|uniref:Secreted protein n=1 Tax=Rickenella mellea TaxID=50990 RepID=A0A4Y7QEA0_9AGAM|nr:hypothetical protein BD410DRAFT_606420 [Rickenella mellea]
MSVFPTPFITFSMLCFTCQIARSYVTEERRCKTLQCGHHRRRIFERSYNSAMPCKITSIFMTGTSGNIGIAQRCKSLSNCTCTRNNVYDKKYRL